MDVADKRAQVLLSVDYVRVIEAKNGPTYPVALAALLS